MLALSSWVDVLISCLAADKTGMPVCLSSFPKGSAVCYCLAQPHMGKADALQWHTHRFAGPSEVPELLMPPHLLGPYMLLLGHVDSSLAGCSRRDLGSLWMPLLCTGSCMPEKSYLLCAGSTRI